jgi:GxxExxY protein
MRDDEFEKVIYDTIGAMIEVHKQLGPGFLENVYHRAFEIELAYRGIKFESEKEVEVKYRDSVIGTHRLDLLVENQLVVELKTVESIGKKHYAQVRSYLKATLRKVALLANFSDYTLDPRRVMLKE